MKADSLKIAKVFSTGGDVHYALPHFQREYAWEKENWKTLLIDVLGIYAVYDEQNPPEHFMGTLVVINDGVQSGTVPVFRLVDGQQRLTTISLMLCALERIAQDAHPALAKKIRRLLVNEDEAGDLHLKLLPTTKYGDRNSYQAIILDKTVPQVESKIPEAFAFLHKELDHRIKQGELDPERLFIVLTTCLQAVFIDLDNKERPYEIFESLNFKGKTLTQADLVRNYIAMKLPQQQQAKVFEEYWSPIEEMLQEKRLVGKSGLGELTAFLRHYLAYLSGVLINEEHVYSRFRDRGQQMTTEAFIEEIRTLKRFATYYDLMLRPEQTYKAAKQLGPNWAQNTDLRIKLQRLNMLEFATGYPFLLFAFDAVDRDLLEVKELVKGLDTLEAYMVRRYLVRDSAGYINRMYPTLRKEIELTRFAESLNTAIATKNYPFDRVVREALETNELYRRGREKLVLILETINRHLSKGSGGFTVLDGKATLEHILPQTPSEAWQKDLGPNWASDYNYVDTIGNLTLVTQDWNSSMSNSAFENKRKALSTNALQLNNGYFANLPTKLRWDAEAIKKRAQFLGASITEIWPAPEVAVALKAAEKDKPKSLTILGELRPVKSWRDVVHQTAEVVVQWVPDFETRIVDKLPNYFSRTEMQFSSRELSNGWWVLVHLSGNDARRLSLKLIELAGIPEDEFELEIW